jgi:hypothetical protein
MKMAKIMFERSGGVLGQTIDTTLDLDTLPSSESRHMLYLIQEADFFRIPENLVAPLTTDEFLYTITVEAGATRHRVRVNDTTMPESLRPLVHELVTLAEISYVRE